MKLIPSLLAILVFACSVDADDGNERERALIEYLKAIRDGNYVKAMTGLTTKEIRANLPTEKLLDRCVPTEQRRLGRFTEYVFDSIPGYHGLTIIAKDGRLKSAVQWSCTYTTTYFDELTSDEEKQYQRLRKENVDVPFERFIGRWGWEPSAKE